MFAYTDELMDTFNRWNGILSAPSPEARKKPQGIRVFTNPILEYSLRAHWIVPGLWVIPTVVFMYFKGRNYLSTSSMAALMVAGVFAWTLLEYGIHKYAFHWKVGPNSSDGVRRLIFGLHGYHHEFPNDPARLVMPIALAWPLGLILGTAIWLLVGTQYFFGLYGGILVGYLAYDWIHYYSHHARPTSRYGKYLHEFHAIHHFVDSESNFGISSPLWDWIFRNNREPRTRLFGN